MSKRYKLSVEKYEDFFADYFYEYEGMTVVSTKNKDEFAVYPGAGTNVTLIEIPKEFQPFLLQEIKEPETFDEWLLKKGNDDHGIYYRDDFTTEDLRECHEWTVKNERKKHEPKQSFDEYAKKLHPGLLKIKPEYDWMWLGWRSATENRGYDE